MFDNDALARKTLDPIFILLAGLLIGFVVIAVFVNRSGVPYLDTRLLLMLRDASDSTKEWGPSWVGETMRDITALGSNWIVAFFSVMFAWYLHLTNKTHLALWFLATVVSGAAFSFMLKLGFSRPRPELVPHATQVYTSSFPSGHAMSSALFFLSLALVVSWRNAYRSAKYLMLTIAVVIPIFVAVSRVYLGVHWPTDVTAGLFIGFFWVLFCFVIARPYLVRLDKN